MTRRHATLAVCRFLLAFLAATGVALGFSDDEAAAARATVGSDSLPMYAAMSDGSRLIKTLDRGDVVVVSLEISGLDGVWCKVRETRESGLSGYVRGESLNREQPREYVSWRYVPPPEPITAPADEALASEKNSLAGATRHEVRREVEKYFTSRFGRSLPVSAFGQTRLHSRWGYNHEQALDIAVHPDSVEGRAIIAFLRKHGVPFIPFRRQVQGVATGPHIHVGRPSPRR